MTHRTSIARLADDAPVPHPDSWPARRPLEHGGMFALYTPLECHARADVHAALKAQAKRTARAMIKSRARDYALRPSELDAIVEGLSRLSPRLLVSSLFVIRLTPYRILCGEVPVINLRAAMWYARYSRAIASRNARRSA
jgi:hypothetical protein